MFLFVDVQPHLCCGFCRFGMLFLPEFFGLRTRIVDLWWAGSASGMRSALLQVRLCANLAGSISPGRSPLSPRATADVDGATTRATPPRHDGDTSTPSRHRLRSATECARLPTTTPRRKTGKRAAVTSGARVRGSGGGSGRKRVQSRARALGRINLQRQWRIG